MNIYRSMQSQIILCYTSNKLHAIGVQMMVQIPILEVLLAGWVSTQNWLANAGQNPVINNLVVSVLHTVVKFSRCFFSKQLKLNDKLSILINSLEYNKKSLYMYVLEYYKVAVKHIISRSSSNTVLIVVMSCVYVLFFMFVVFVAFRKTDLKVAGSNTDKLALLGTWARPLATSCLLYTWIDNG